MIDRHVGITVDVVHDRVAGLLPIIIVVTVPHRLDQPALVFRNVLEGRGAGADRQVEQMLRHPLAALYEGLPQLGIGQSGSGVGRADGEDPIHEAELEGPAVANPGDAAIRYGIDRDHAGQIGRSRAGEGMLRATDVAGPKRPDLAV